MCVRITKVSDHDADGIYFVWSGTVLAIRIHVTNNTNPKRRADRLRVASPRADPRCAGARVRNVDRDRT